LYILDTNPISIIERRGPSSEKLLTHLTRVDASTVYVTVVSYEEQIRGWTAAIAATRSTSAQVIQYARLLEQLEIYCKRAILPFTSDAAMRYDELRGRHRRISSPDLKIAAIVLENDGTLITQNERDFRSIVGLKLEDWTR
jgi:tRNA(fMet)-specific endonuclease VapC